MSFNRVEIFMIIYIPGAESFYVYSYKISSLISNNWLKQKYVEKYVEEMICEE